MFHLIAWVHWRSINQLFISHVSCIDFDIKIQLILYLHLYSQFYGLVPHDDISRQNEGFDVHYVCISTLCPHVKPLTLKRKVTKCDPKREMKTKRKHICEREKEKRVNTGYVSIILNYVINISLYKTSKPIMTILTNILFIVFIHMHIIFYPIAVNIFFRKLQM